MKPTPLEKWVWQKINSKQPGLERDEIMRWQVKKFNETLSLARTKSPFYRKLFSRMPDHIDKLDEISQFPFTTPEDIRRNPLQFVCVSQDEIQRVVTLQSSGTTGEPKRIYFTAEDQELTKDFFGIGMSSLTEPGEKVLIFLPGELPDSVGDLLRIGLERMGRLPIPYGPVRDPEDALEVMQNQQAGCLVGSPTQILNLARRWNPQNKAPRTILLSTDYVPAAIVQTLEKIWGCEVFNHYGATEMGLGGGVECSAHRGLHLREADMYYEVIDPQTGESVPDGTYGEVVFSTLTRRGMPLIRYRMGDRSRFLTGECPCGTHLKTMECVSGRFSGFIPVGDTLLRLPDFDEELFLIPDLLNFSVTLNGNPGNEQIGIQARMLTQANATGQIEQALHKMAVLQHYTIKIDCIHAPKEPGSLLKRTIVDRRDVHA